MKDNSVRINKLTENIERMTGEVELQAGNMDLNLLSDLLELRSASIEELSKTEYGRDSLIDLLGSLQSRDAVVRARLKLMKSEFGKKIEDSRKIDKARRKYSMG